MRMFETLLVLYLFSESPVPFCEMRWEGKGETTEPLGQWTGPPNEQVSKPWAKPTTTSGNGQQLQKCFQLLTHHTSHAQLDVLVGVTQYKTLFAPSCGGGDCWRVDTRLFWMLGWANSAVTPLLHQCSKLLDFRMGFPPF